MKKSKKIATGIALGAVVALFLIPKTRKMITERVGDLTCSLKDLLHKSDGVVSNA